jgi:tetratricopeptide (TPR) repeat protein
MFRKAGALLAVAIGLGNLGAIAQRRGDPVRAAELHREALATARTLSDPGLEGWARTNLAGALYRAGESATAAPLVAKGIAQLVAAEDAVTVLNALGCAAAILAASGDTETAVIAWSAAEANAERLGFPLERDESDDADIANVRSGLELRLWQEWTRVGAALDYKDAVELVVGRLTAPDTAGAQ